MKLYRQNIIIYIIYDVSCERELIY